MMKLAGNFQLIIILMIVFTRERSLRGVSADYAPEKMDRDNEARLEMNLEPRSSIPHPRNSVPVTPASTLYVTPITTEMDDGSGINSPNSHQLAGTDNSTMEEDKRVTTLTNNKTAHVVNAPAISPTVSTTLQNTSSSNTNLTTFSFPRANQNLTFNEVSKPQIVHNSAYDLNLTTENKTSQSAQSQSNVVTNTELQVASSESISFGTLSKPLTPINSLQNVQEKAEDSKYTQQNSQPTTAPYTIPTNKPMPITTAATYSENDGQSQIKDNTSKINDYREDQGQAAKYQKYKDTSSQNEEQKTKMGDIKDNSSKNDGQKSNMSDFKDNSSRNEDQKSNMDDFKNVQAQNKFNKSKINEFKKVQGQNKVHKSTMDDYTKDAQRQNKGYKFKNNDFKESNLDMENGSGSDNQEEAEADANRPSSSQSDSEESNDVSDNNEDDVDEEEDDDSGSGDEDAPSFLHVNHTLSSTSGALKQEAKENPMDESSVEDKDAEKAVEDAIDRTIDRETDYEDKGDKSNSEGERNEKQVDTLIHRPQIHPFDKQKEVKDTKMGINKQPPQRKPDTSKTSINHPSHQERHHEVKAAKKLSARKDSEQIKHLKPEKKHPILKHEEKPKKPLMKYFNRVHYQSNVFLPHAIKTPTPTCNSDEIKTGYSLKGGTRAGHVDDLGESAGIHECIKRCCRKDVCDVALLLDGRCFGVACFTKDLCQPVPIPHPHYVASQIAFLKQAQRRTEVERANPEFDCKYGELTIRNNHRWTGELCGGVLACKNGIIHLEKCPGIPPIPTNCANPKLYVKQRPGRCCLRKWQCKDKSCMYGVRKIPHGVSLSDPLCTGVIKCFNGQLKTVQCPGIPEKPKNCGNPRLKITSVPGKCCRRKWVCQDKSCTYNKLKVDHGERLTDASCAVVMECDNGFLNFKQCPSTPTIPHGCINPRLQVKRVLGECCHMKWKCAPEL